MAKLMMEVEGKKFLIHLEEDSTREEFTDALNDMMDEAKTRDAFVAP